MRIGVLTLIDSNSNYGQVMQAYALNQFLINNGFEVYFVNYNYLKLRKSNNFIHKIKQLFNIKKIYLKLFKKQVVYEIDRGFKNFRNTHLHMIDCQNNKLHDLEKNFNLDLLIVGSDQVWNFDNSLKYNKKLINFFMLKDCVSKKISCAASFGRYNISTREAKYLNPLLKKFDFITVREKSGVNICSFCGVDSKWVCDPTLILNRYDYDMLIEKTKKFSDKKYMLIYYLDNGGIFDMKEVINFAISKKLEIKYISANGKLNDELKQYILYPTIEEWISLIKHAEYIVTNSFHCCIFSMIYEKKFGVISLNGVNAGMNSRIESLFEITNVKPRYIYQNDLSELDNYIQKINIDNNNLLSNQLAEYFKNSRK